MAGFEEKKRNQPTRKTSYLRRCVLRRIESVFSSKESDKRACIGSSPNLKKKKTSPGICA
jgi:hypothetical protein